MATPTQVGSDTDWAFVSANLSHTIALKTNGSLWGWGKNFNGQVAAGRTGRIGKDSDWAFVSTSAITTLALKTDGSLWAWGGNGDGQFGNGTSCNSISEGIRRGIVRIGTDTDWVAVAAGNTSAGIKANGSLWVWGANGSGQLGNGTQEPSLVPIQVPGAWAFVTTGPSIIAAVRPDGTLWCWGHNSDGQVGNGRITTGFSRPFQIPGFIAATPGSQGGGMSGLAGRAAGIMGAATGQAGGVVGGLKGILGGGRTGGGSRGARGGGSQGGGAGGIIKGILGSKTRKR